MGTTSLIIALAASILGSPMNRQVVDQQDKTFQRYWGTDFQWKFDELPTKGMVPKYRLPYSGYIYPDRGGGTQSVLRKYDYAFNGGRGSAASWEHWDTSSGPSEPRRFGLFGGWGRNRVPGWYGHCNGWTSAAIRHAEPTKSVTRNGVTFTPSDIKGLLAEIYIYNDSENLAGSDFRINAGEFHAIIANWLGRGSHPLGMESDPGEEKWNYPIYSYACSFAKRANRRVEVKTNLAYTKDSNGEYEQSPHIRAIKYFHYMLELNENGQIVGGSFFYDSSIIDMLWVPMRPRQGGYRGNERGNPYVDVKQVLAIWRDSVDEDVRKKWYNIQPSEEDRIADVSGAEGLVPLQGLARAQSKPPATAPAESAPADASKTVAAANAKVAGTDATAAKPAATEAEAGEAGKADAEPAAAKADSGDAAMATPDAENADSKDAGTEPAAVEAEGGSAPADTEAEKDDSNSAGEKPAASEEKSGDSETADTESATVDERSDGAEMTTGDESAADAAKDRPADVPDEDPPNVDA